MAPEDRWRDKHWTTEDISHLPFPAGKITNHRVKVSTFPFSLQGHYPPESSEALFFNVDSVLGIVYSYSLLKEMCLISFAMTHILLKVTGFL